MPKIKILTLTNNGYLTYTLNCLESLRKIGINNVDVYAIGKKAHTRLKNQNFNTKLINDASSSEFQQFRTGNWSSTTFHKFEIIHENLKTHDYVCFTDGDITFKDKRFLAYCEDNIKNFDLLIQNDQLLYDQLLYIRLHHV